MKATGMGILLVGLLILASCSSSNNQGSSTSDTSVFDGAMAAKPDGQVNSVAGLEFTPPSDWTDNGPSGMRAAEYSYGPIEGESDPAVMTVFYFGPGQGGDVKSNLDRWVGQVSKPGGGAVTDEAVLRSFTVADLPVSTVEVAGTYSASMGGPMSGNKVDHENYRLYGAVVEGPQGSVFFKLTGPDKTAEGMATGFANMIHTIEKSTGQMN